MYIWCMKTFGKNSLFISLAVSAVLFAGIVFIATKDDDDKKFLYIGSAALVIGTGMTLYFASLINVDDEKLTIKKLLPFEEPETYKLQNIEKIKVSSINNFNNRRPVDVTIYLKGKEPEETEIRGIYKFEIKKLKQHMQQHNIEVTY